jgi:7-cyano-7-deazaguanine synthase
VGAATERGTIGVLLSGGLDSSILLAHLLEQKRQVQPFYVRSRLVWQDFELAAVGRFLSAVATPNLKQLVVLDLPLTDLYADHWSVTGEGSPDADSPDEAVFLPGRNALLVIKATVWCQLNGIQQIALAPLGTSPFADATAAFFEHFETALNQGNERPLRILRPFAEMTKSDVMRLGDGLPLELTFSCISPRNGLHCGECNKCAERQSAFRAASLIDTTFYDSPAVAPDAAQT